MYLTSSLVPDGHKSNKQYLVLNCKGQRDLIPLPQSFSDLEQEVESLYNINPGRFYIESDELSLCKGERVRIPERAWDDLVLLLGNVYIINKLEPLDASNLEKTGSVESDTMSEAGSKTDDSGSKSPQPPPSPPDSKVPLAKEGNVGLESPLVNDEVLLVKVGGIDFDVDAESSSEFQLQLLDKHEGRVLTVSILPGQEFGEVFLTSSTDNTIATFGHLKHAFRLETDVDHHIIIFKEDTRFFLLCDSHVIASVNAPTHDPIAAIQYDLGVHSPFSGPISAITYKSLPYLLEASTKFEQHALFAALDTDSLYHKILDCDSRRQPMNAVEITNALATIQKEIRTFGRSGSGTKWRGHTLNCNQWADIGLGTLRPRSMIALRYQIPGDVPSSPAPILLYFQSIIAGGQRATSLQMSIDHNQLTKFREQIGDNIWDNYHTCWLGRPEDGAPRMHSPGEHTITLVNDDGNLRVILDFGWSLVLPKNTLLSRNNDRMYFSLQDTRSVEVDVYEL